jgi:hypothetical protein
MSDRRIRIAAGDVTVFAALDDSPMGEAVWGALPISGRAQIWGDEIYFRIPVDEPENAGEGEETVKLGAIGYWPPGKALCFFFGPTPMSVGNEIRPASAVHVMGMIEGDSKVLKRVPSGAAVRVERGGG